MKERGLVRTHPDFPVCVDSPLANEATRIFSGDLHGYLDEAAIEALKGGALFQFPGLTLTESSEESKALNLDKASKVIISASGMCDAGRIRHHLKHNLWRPESTIVFVGYQAEGSLGRALLEGASSVRLFGEEIAVRARIVNFKGMSSHADRDHLLAWVGHFAPHPSHVFVVHGDAPVTEIFAQHLSSGADITAVCAPVSQADPRMTNYFTLDGEGRVTDIAVNPPAHNGDASLETYILSKSLLLSLVDQCAAHDVASFSQGVLLSTRGRVDLRAYRFDGYAARVLSVAGYFQRSMELLDPTVRASLFNPDRPVKTKDQSNPSTYYGPGSVCKHSLVADGCFIEGEVENSILSRGVIVEKGAKVSNSVLMQGTVIKAGASLSYVITDKNVKVNEDRMLMGHSTYPLAISKNSIV